MWFSAREALVVFAAVLFGTSACAKSRSTADADTRAPVARTQLQLRCEQQPSVLDCQAVASDADATSANDNRDVTDAVSWTMSDPGAVRVDRGRIHADRGGLTSVTATWTQAPGAPSASVFVLADAQHDTAREAFVVEGEVRLFPSTEGIGDVRVSLIDEHGTEQAVMTPPERPDRDATGRFQFRPVPAGPYTLRAVLEGYHTTEETVIVPDHMAHTLILVGAPTPHP